MCGSRYRERSKASILTFRRLENNFSRDTHARARVSTWLAAPAVSQGVAAKLARQGFAAAHSAGGREVDARTLTADDIFFGECVHGMGVRER